MEFEAPIRIISDIHFGHGASRVHSPEQLVPLFRGMKTVVFNGDTTELRFIEDRPEAQRHLERIRGLCAEAGAEPFFLNGNHDPIASGLGHLDLGEGSVLVTHGDVLFYGISPWSREADVLEKAHARELASLGQDALKDFEKRLAANHRAALAVELHKSTRPTGRWAKLTTLVRECWPPTRPLRIFRCWWEMPAKAEVLAKTFRPEARFLVLGHTHFSGIWRRGGRVIINTGSFLPFSGLSAVDLAEGRLIVRRIVCRDGLFHPGRPVADFSIAGA